MLLADSSVIIERSRRRDRKLVALFGSLQIATCGLVRAEVLSGTRSMSEHARLMSILDSLDYFRITRSDWDYIGDTRSLIFSHGVSMSLPDVAIGCMAIISNIELWSRDNAHIQMAALIPALRLFAEPP